MPEYMIVKNAHLWPTDGGRILYNRFKDHRWAFPYGNVCGFKYKMRGKRGKEDEMKTQQAVVNRIENICKERRITVNQLAYISAVAPSTLKNIMYGNSANTGVVTIAKLCNGLDVSLPVFFGDDVFWNLDPEID